MNENANKKEKRMVRRIETEGSGLKITNVEGKRMEMISERERERES